MSAASPGPPQLLVSVRSSAEARVALAGGCDILDVKEPLHGALGMAPPEALQQIAVCLADQAAPPPWSVALGELAEWPDDRPLPQLPAGIDFVKVGVAGLSRAGVSERLPGFMRRLATVLPQGARSPGWILATYADFDRAHAASPHGLFEVARQAGCTGLLIDTWAKQGPGLTGCLDESTLQSLQTHARQLQLPLALAGRLQLADIPTLRRVGPEIVGIRSAACVDGLRTGTLSASAISRFRAALAVPASAQALGADARSGVVSPGVAVGVTSGAGPVLAPLTT